jgi:hypothetical protein
VLSADQLEDMALDHDSTDEADGKIGRFGLIFGSPIFEGASSNLFRTDRNRSSFRSKPMTTSSEPVSSPVLAIQDVRLRFV